MISVVMGVHRFDEYVEKAILSILTQSFAQIEFIIVVNGDQAESVYSEIEKITSEDKRVRILKTQIGQLAHALNVGIDAAKYEYIARMDADDISHPSRLEVQISYLKDNNLDLVGTNLSLIDEKGRFLGERTYPVQNKINRLLPLKNCFAHNTVLFSKKIFLKARGYNAGFNSEDYDLWLRMKRLNARWDNIQTPLLDYRIHSNSSQRRLLGYAESSGYALREFLLKKSLTNFFAVFVHVFKSIFRAR